MFATTISRNEIRTQLQQSLDRETVRTQSQEVGLDDNAMAFTENQADPAAPIFRRSALRPKNFQVDLFGEWARA